MKKYIKLLLLVLPLAALTFSGAGCSTTAESENMSSRPWNSPRGWEYGIPGMMPGNNR
jgi:hypothetical protein